MLKIKNFLIIFSGALFSLISIAPSAPAYAAVKDDIQAGACGAAGQAACDSAAATSSIDNTITGVINLLSVVIGVIAVIMLILGGFKYVTSAGNEQAVAGAKRTLLYAIIGLIVVALSQVIARFVLNNVT